MKDVVIRGKSIRRELIIFALCIVAACIWNAYAIVKYGTSWSELYTLWYVVVPVGAVVYLGTVAVRLVLRGILFLVCSKRGTGKAGS